MTLGAHPMSLIREGFGEDLSSSADLPRLRSGREVRVAGMVIARQRPATANGVLFMLLEDEWGTINLVVPPPTYRRSRLVARAAPFLLATGRLESRGANINIVVTELERLDRPDLPAAEVKHIEPPRTLAPAENQPAMAELAAALPAAHSFGRRGH
jgi:error-prone DNA polymerase